LTSLLLFTLFLSSCFYILYLHSFPTRRSSDLPIEGIGIVNEKAAYFIPTEVAAGSDVFKTWANDTSKKKIVFDVKKVFVALLHKEIYLTGVTFYMFFASYFLNPEEINHNIIAIYNS